MITLHMQPDQAPMLWDEFTSKAPPFSIALDGYVQGGPRFDPRGPWMNANHHEECDRLATRATCAQVHLAIRQGLFACFRDTSGPVANIYVNDCDQDVCLSVWLLRHHCTAGPTMNALLNRLVGLEDMLDTTAGAYPLPVDLAVLGDVAWIFAPYTDFRGNGGLRNRNAAAFENVVELVGARIDRYLLCEGKRLPLDVRYERIQSMPTWSLVHETGAQARTGMFADGIRAFISVRDRGNGTWDYVVGRMSLFIPFNVMAILDGINLAEGVTGADRAGGNDIIGGTARIRGCKLPPSEIVRIACAFA
jgi:hypothetical protein